MLAEIFLKVLAAWQREVFFLGIFTNPRLLQLLDNEMNKSSAILHLQDHSVFFVVT